jgi:hypothetical protein
MGSVGKSSTAHALAWYLSNYGSSYFGGLGNHPKYITDALKRAKVKKPRYSCIAVPSLLRCARVFVSTLFGIVCLNTILSELGPNKDQRSTKQKGFFVRKCFVN